MTPKEQKLIEKLKEIIMHVGFGSYPIEDLHRDLDNSSCPDCKKLGKELSELESDLSALEQETKRESEEVFAVMADALYATGRFNTDQCDNLVDGVLIYLHEAGYKIVPQSPGLRDELIAFSKFRENESPYSAIINHESYVDNYLNSKSGK